MKILCLVTLFFILPSLICFSQKVIGSSSIFLEYSENDDKKSIKYFWGEKSDVGLEYEDELTDKLLISLKNRQNINFYWKWINPLKYQISWKDSVLVDERYEEVDKYISRVTALLVPAAMISPIAEEKFLGEKSLDGKSNTSVVTVKDPKKGLVVNLNIPVDIQNKNINLMYVTILSMKGELLAADVDILNKVYKDIQQFNDDSFKSNQSTIKGYFKTLFDLNSAEFARKTSDNLSNDLEVLNARLDVLAGSISTYETLFSKIDLSNNLVEYQVNFYLSEAVSDARKLLETDRELIKNLNPIITTIKNSLLTPTIDIRLKNGAEYVKVKSSSFSTGKKVQSQLSIQKYDFDDKKIEFRKSGDPLVKEFTIQKYNFIYPTFSTGIFYASSSINYLGLTNVEDSEDFEITEEEIKKNNPSFAAFMNLNFDLKSDFFSPFIQFGIDPTKNKPFILSGIGFYVPVSKFAISGGGVWVFDQQLKTLNIGDRVASTTDLDKDISYTLNPKPKGFYIGIQYAF